MRELDLVLEAYLDRHADTMSVDEADVFERFLDSTDMDLYYWVTGRSLPQDPQFAAIVSALHQPPV